MSQTFHEGGSVSPDARNFRLEVNNMTTTKTERPTTPLEDSSFDCLDHNTLAKVVKYLEAIERLETEVGVGDGVDVFLNSPIMVQSEGFRLGWLKPVDDFWVFVPDIKADHVA